MGKKNKNIRPLLLDSKHSIVAFLSALKLMTKYFSRKIKKYLLFSHSQILLSPSSTLQNYKYNIYVEMYMYAHILMLPECI